MRLTRDRPLPDRLTNPPVAQTLAKEQPLPYNQPANAFLTLEASTIWQHTLTRLRDPFVLDAKTGDCPNKSVFACEPVCNHSDDYLIKGKFNGVDAQFKLDTVASYSLVCRSGISKKVLTGEKISLVCVKGPPVEFDLTEISKNIDGTQADIIVAVTGDMGTDALLGKDIPFINQLLKPLMDERRKKEIHICLVQTRK